MSFWIVANGISMERKTLLWIRAHSSGHLFEVSPNFRF